MKKSFIIYNDSLSVLELLSTEQIGQLFLAIKDYQLGNELSLSLDMKLAFEPFKNQFLRDEIKYKNIVERNKVNGSKGGRPSKPKKPSGLSGNPKNPEKPRKADSDSDSVSDSDKEKNKAFDAFWNNYPKKTDRKRATLAFNKLNKTNAALATKDCSIRFTDTESRFIPHATTYLNGERWFDELPSGVVEEKKGYYAGVRYET